MQLEQSRSIRRKQSLLGNCAILFVCVCVVCVCMRVCALVLSPRQKYLGVTIVRGD